MRISEYLQQQYSLQDYLGLPMGEGTSAVKENILALIVEATELLGEFPWKKWRKDQGFFVRDDAVEEAVDLFRFYCNILNELQVTEEEFDQYWFKTENKTRERYENGK